MPEEVSYAVRELRSAGKITYTVTRQDEQGESQTIEKIIYGPIASGAATTRDEIYEDDNNRCFDIQTDESEAQSQRIIAHIQAQAAGKLDHQAAQKIKVDMQNAMRVLKAYEVVNPYLSQLEPFRAYVQRQT